MYSLKVYSLVDADGEDNKIPEGVKKKILLKIQKIKNLLMFCLIKLW